MPPPKTPAVSPPPPNPPKSGPPKTPGAPVAPGSQEKGRRRHDLDDIDEFTNTDMINADDVEKVLSHYGSPLEGKGHDLVDVARAWKINPALMLAITQKESSYGKGGEIHEANPFSVHFRNRKQLQPGEKPIDMLRPKPDELPTFRQSAEAAAKTINKLKSSGDKPFSAVAASYSEKPDEWKSDVEKFYLKILTRVGKQ